MKRRVTDLWTTAFAKFVEKRGATKLAEDLQVVRTAVYHWIEGTTSPRPDKAIQIVEIAKSARFQLTLVDIYAHRHHVAKVRARNLQAAKAAKIQ
jgi:hypothetical protein